MSLHLSSFSLLVSLSILINSHIEGTFTAAFDIPEINNPKIIVNGDLIIFYSLKKVIMKKL
jgi:hypothetical protein